MIIDGNLAFFLLNILLKEKFSFKKKGIFKNNQAQVDEYLNVLNPILRRTTEGNQLNRKENRSFFCSQSIQVNSIGSYAFIDDIRFRFTKDTISFQ